MSVEAIIALVVGGVSAIALAVREWFHRRALITAEQAGRMAGLEEERRRWQAGHDAAVARDAAIAEGAAAHADAAETALEARAVEVLRQPITDETVAKIIERSKGRGGRGDK